MRMSGIEEEKSFLPCSLAILMKARPVQLQDVTYKAPIDGCITTQAAHSARYDPRKRAYLTWGLWREEFRCMSSGFGSGEASLAARAGVSSADKAAEAASQRGLPGLPWSIPESLPSARAASMAW